MDGITAKRILIALVKKLGYSTVRRANYDHQYALIAIKNGFSRKVLVKPIDETSFCKFNYFTCKSSRWEQLLNALVGCEVRLSVGRDCIAQPLVAVYSVEQLAIDLELEGHLKNV